MNSNSKYLNRVTIASLMVALGIIYGDIGTSPLYVLKAVIGDRKIDETLVYGGVSLIFWTLVFQTTIKYIILTLRADNQGEGGVFSLYALVRSHGKFLVIATILGATTLLANGIITPTISIASAIEARLSMDDAVYQSMRLSARELAEKQFDININIPKWLSVYERSLNGSKKNETSMLSAINQV